jgi:hypothetical protein
MRHQRKHLEPPIVKPEQGPDAHVVAFRFHRPGDAVEPPEIIVFASVDWVDFGICRVVVGFLEDLIRADARRLDGRVAFVVHRRGVQIDAADFARARASGIDVPDAIGHELGVVIGMLAEDEDQPLVSLAFQGENLLADFLFVQRAANLVAVRAAERAVLAIVAALVADVQRREQHDPVAVNIAFELPGGVKNLLDKFGPVGCQERGRLFHGQRLLGHALRDDLADSARVGRPIEQPVENVFVDEVDPTLTQSHFVA